MSLLQKIREFFKKRPAKQRKWGEELNDRIRRSKYWVKRIRPDWRTTQKWVVYKGGISSFSGFFCRRWKMAEGEYKLWPLDGPDYQSFIWQGRFLVRYERKRMAGLKESQLVVWMLFNEHSGQWTKLARLLFDMPEMRSDNVEEYNQALSRADAEDDKLISHLRDLAPDLPKNLLSWNWSEPRPESRSWTVIQRVPKYRYEKRGNMVFAYKVGTVEKAFTFYPFSGEARSFKSFPSDPVVFMRQDPHTGQWNYLGRGGRSKETGKWELAGK